MRVSGDLPALAQVQRRRAVPLIRFDHSRLDLFIACASASESGSNAPEQSVIALPFDDYIIECYAAFGLRACFVRA